MTLLLATLHEMRAIRAKQEALAHLNGNHYFDIQAEDLEPYQSQTEPRWHTMIAWARKDCVQRGLMFNHDENDHWEITRKGLNQFEKVSAEFAKNPDAVRQCYFWTLKFKELICPGFVPSDRDRKRPKSHDYAMYQDYD